MNRENRLEQIKKYKKQWYAANREKELKRMKEYNKEYHKTPMGRASKLLMNYNKADKKRGRGEGDLTAKWIVDNIFSKPCAHCGRSGWEIIGCNRLDNSKPHTKDNVEPCCYECNLKLEGKEHKQVYQYSLDGELVKVWESTQEVGRNGFDQAHISSCCNGIRKTSGGYKWSYTPPPS